MTRARSGAAGTRLAASKRNSAGAISVSIRSVSFASSLAPPSAVPEHAPMPAFPAYPRSTAWRAAVALLVAAVPLAGCTPSGGFAGRPTSRAPNGAPTPGAETTKEVVAKRPPRELVARDGSVCRVGEAVLDATRVGAQYRCRWSTGAGEP